METLERKRREQTAGTGNGLNTDSGTPPKGLGGFQGRAEIPGASGILSGLSEFTDSGNRRAGD